MRLKKARKLGQPDSNRRMQQSKCCALPLGDSPKWLSDQSGWNEGLEPSISRTTIWRVNQLRYSHHIKRVCPKGFEPPTHGLEGRCSIQLSYGHILGNLIKLYPDKYLPKRVMGIELTYPAWKAGVLPLNYTRISDLSLFQFKSG